MKELYIKKNEVNGYTWIDVCNPTLKELEEIAKEYKLHAYTVKDCLEPGHLPKIEYADNYKFVIMRCYSPTAKDVSHTIQDLTMKIAVFFSENFIITIHRNPQPFLASIKEKFCDIPGITPPQLLTRMMWHTLHSFEAPALIISDETDDYEKRIFLNHKIHSLQEKLYYIKHRASVIKKVLILTTEIINFVNQIQGNNPYIQDLKDLHLKLVTIYDQVQEDINNLLSISISLAAQKTNEVMKVLTILTVFFMPPTFIVGIYGMNFQYMPGLDYRAGYYVILVFMATLSLGTFLWFKRKKWL